MLKNQKKTSQRARKKSHLVQCALNHTFWSTPSTLRLTGKKRSLHCICHMANFSKFIACSFYLSNMYGRKAQNWLSYVLLALHMAPAGMVWVSSIRISIALVIRTQSSHDCFSHKSKKSFGLGLLSEAKHSQPLYSLPAHFPPVSSALLMGIFQRAVPCSPCCIQPGDTQKQACFRELPTSLLTHLYHSSWLPSLTWQRAGSVYTVNTPGHGVRAFSNQLCTLPPAASPWLLLLC